MITATCDFRDRSSGVIWHNFPLASGLDGFMTSKENLPVTGLRLQGSDLPKTTRVGAELGADSDLLPWAGARPSRRSAAPARPPGTPGPHLVPRQTLHSHHGAVLPEPHAATASFSTQRLGHCCTPLEFLQADTLFPLHDTQGNTQFTIQTRALLILMWERHRCELGSSQVNQELWSLITSP